MSNFIKDAAAAITALKELVPCLLQCLQSIDASIADLVAQEAKIASARQTKVQNLLRECKLKFDKVIRTTDFFEQKLHGLGTAGLRALNEARDLLGRLFGELDEARKMLSETMDKAAGLIEDCKMTISQGRSSKSTQESLATMVVGLSLIAGYSVSRFGFGVAIAFSAGWAYKTYRARQQIDEVIDKLNESKAELESLIRDANRTADKTVEMEHMLRKLANELDERIREEERRLEQRQQQVRPEVDRICSMR